MKSGIPVAVVHAAGDRTAGWQRAHHAVVAAAVERAGVALALYWPPPVGCVWPSADTVVVAAVDAVVVVASMVVVLKKVGFTDKKIAKRESEPDFRNCESQK